MTSVVRFLCGKYGICAARTASTRACVSSVPVTRLGAVNPLRNLCPLLLHNSQHSVQTPYSRMFVRTFTSKKRLPFEVDTNVTKDVLLFSNREGKFYKWLTVFGILQFAFWCHCGIFAYSKLRDAPQERTGLPWWRRINLGENMYRNGIALLCFSVGYVLLFICLIYPKRAVRDLWLMSGGGSVRLATYTALGRSNSTVLPLEHITCLQHRAADTTQLPMKVKGKWFYFLMDTSKGEFHEPKLFDNTVGIQRTFK